MEDCNEQKGVQFFLCNLAYMSSQPGTSTFLSPKRLFSQLLYNAYRFLFLQ